MSLKAAQLDTQRLGSPLNPRVAQHPHLLRPLGAVHAVQIVAQAGVAAKLGNAGWERLKDLDQVLDRDLTGQWRAFRGLAAEVSIVPHRWTATPQGNIKLARHADQQGPSRLVLMNVLVRVDMGRLTSGEASKGRQLAGDSSATAAASSAATTS